MKNKFAKALEYAKEGTLGEAVRRKVGHIRERMEYGRDFRTFTRMARRVPFVGVEADGSVYIVSTADHSVGFTLFRQKNAHFAQRIEGFYEWTKTNLGYLREPDPLLINVGANIGAAVIPSVQKGFFSSAIAFEPEPLNHTLLEVNIRMNGLQERVRAYRVALSNENKKKNLYISEHNKGAHAVFDAGIHEAELTSRWDKKNALKPGLEVECRTFDDFAKEQGIATDKAGLVFMDIEGHEGHFLAGAQELLKSGVPVVTEFCPPFLRRSKGMEMFVENATSHFKRMLINPFKQTPDQYEVVGIEKLHELMKTETLYDILLIPR